MENSNIYPEFAAKRLGDYVVKTRFINKPDLSKSELAGAIGNYNIYTSPKAGFFYVINETTEFYGLGSIEKK